MNKKKKHKRKAHPPKRNSTAISDKNNLLNNRIIKFLIWLITATGVVSVISLKIADFFTGEVQIQEIKPWRRGYEFKLFNDTPTDQIIEKFRIYLADKSKVVFRVDKEINGIFTKNGVTLPNGNTTSVPIGEFKEIDNVIVNTGKEVNFYVPPLVAVDYVIPEYVVVFVEYSTKSKNEYVAKLESVLVDLGFKDGKKKKKFLVINNHWTPINSDNDINALKLVCRDDDILSKSIDCQQYHEQ